MTAVRFDIAPCPTASSDALQQALGLSRVTADVLVRRGLGDPDDAQAFLAAERPVYDPLLLGDCARAVELISAALDDNRRIVVHGDYDADGVCATTLLLDVLSALGGDVAGFLPSRFEEGYGLAVTTVERLAEEGFGLLITVDCGITAVDAAVRARELDLELIITDHHQPGPELPDCPLVVPHSRGSYPFPSLCGTGVALRLAEALIAARGADPELAARQLDLVAIATVADVVPLQDENRALVRAGIEELRRGRRPGLVALMMVAKTDFRTAGSQEIAFRIAPRLNAAGRMEHPGIALELLGARSKERAWELAERLDALNRERRAVELEIMDQAVGAAERLPAHRRDARGVVLASSEWHPGVIGIVASRMVERLRRPVVLIAFEDGVGRGSGRSVPGFDLLGGLRAGSEHLEAFGGHRAAAGLTIRAERLEDFSDAFAAHCDAVLLEEDLVPVERIDAVVSLADVSLDLADEIARLEPFGEGNPAVSVLIPAASLEGVSTLGAEGRHLQMTVRTGAGSCRCVWWGAGAAVGSLAGMARADVACRIERNDWNGSSSVQLVARAVAEMPRRPLPAPARAHERIEVEGAGGVVDLRGGSAVAELTRLAASGEGLAIVCRDAERRRALVEGPLHPHRFGLRGEAAVGAESAADAPLVLLDWQALAEHEDVALALGRLAVLDPPLDPDEQALLDELSAAVDVYLVAGAAEHRPAAAG